MLKNLIVALGLASGTVVCGRCVRKEICTVARNRASEADILRAEKVMYAMAKASTPEEYRELMEEP